MNRSESVLIGRFGEDENINKELVMLSEGDGDTTPECRFESLHVCILLVIKPELLKPWAGLG
jgi:hypothetical protein